MKRLGEMDQATGYDATEQKMRATYPVHRKVYEDSGHGLEVFYALLGINTLHSSSHRHSAVKSVFKAISRLEDGKYSVEVYMKRLQEKTLRNLVLAQDLKGLIEKAEEAMTKMAPHSSASSVGSLSADFEMRTLRSL